jgi:hypothetical protein
MPLSILPSFLLALFLPLFILLLRPQEVTMSCCAMGLSCGIARCMIILDDDLCFYLCSRKSDFFAPSRYDGKLYKITDSSIIEITTILCFDFSRSTTNILNPIVDGHGRISTCDRFRRSSMVPTQDQVYDLITVDIQVPVGMWADTVYSCGFSHTR